MKYGIIENGICINVILADSSDIFPGKTLVEVPAGFGKGDQYNLDTGEWSKVETLTLADAITEKKAAIETKRDAQITAGMAYPFPDGSGPVQMNSDNDHRNLQTIAIRALGLIQMGDATTQISIWDADGTEHFMTGAQAAEFAEFVGAWGESCYKVAANIHAAAVDAIAKDETLTGAERIARVNAYDYSGSWPE